MYKTLLLIGFVLLSGCYTAAGTGKVDSIDSVKTEMTKKSPKDKDAVVALYGDPTAVFTKNGKETYEYKYVSASFNPWSAVPIVGMFVSTYWTKVNYLYVSFDSNGTVSSFDAIGYKGSLK